MGRKRIYFTSEQQVLANRAKSKRYYERNKKIVCQKRLTRYYQKKKENANEKK